MTDFSYQLYSSRNFPPLADTLKMLARLGYKQVEGYGALYADDAKVEELKRSLEASGLTMPTGHFGLDMLEREPDKVLGIAEALGIETLYCPLPRRRPAPRHRRRLARLRQAAAGGRRPLPRRRPRLRLAQPRLRVRAAARRLAADGGDLRGRPRPRVGGRHRLGGPRRRRPLRVDQDLRQADHRGPRQGHRARRARTDEDGWADVGDGTMDWKGLMAALQGAPVQGLRHGARQPERRRPLRRALARRRQAVLRGAHDGQARHRHHRLRQHLRPPTSRLAPLFKRPRGPRLRRPRHRRPPRRGRASSTSSAQTVEALLGEPGHRRRHQPDRSPTPTTPSPPARSRPASTSTPRSPSC